MTASAHWNSTREAVMKRNRLMIMAELLKFVKPLSGYMALAVLLGTLGNLCAAFIPVLAGQALLKSMRFAVKMSLGGLFAWMLVCGVLRAVLRYGEQASNHYIAFRLLALVRDRVFRALRRLSPAKLEGKDRGDLIAVITADVELLEVFYAHTISPICIALLFTIVLVVLIWRIHPMLGLLALCSYAAIGIALPLLISMQDQDTGREVRRLSGELSSSVLEDLRGLYEVLQYEQGDARTQRRNDLTDALLEEQEEQNTLAGRNRAAAGTMIYLFDCMMIFGAYMLYGQGTVAFDGMVTAILLLMSSFGPVSALAALGTTLSNTLAAGDRVLHILAEEPVTEDITGQQPAIYGSIAAENVSFSYGAEPVLNDMSVFMNKDQIIGITGRSGSGKSTFLKLLMRFWKPDSGRLGINDRDIESINTSDLRDMEGYMTQDTHLFHDTVRNNLLIARPDASEEEIMEACRKASVHEAILRLPDGYDTVIGELGDTLSGGERQRISLARAFLHDARILLLDEPTSNLDALNEGMILKALDEEKNHRTIVLVLHRGSSVRIADTVLHMEEGRLES
ncbi:MAG: ABC transporter ATP-binding protein [Solobacterium sp.]|nr:ABC transporter ATP-binding protein [Solobacterium sp.]